MAGFGCCFGDGDGGGRLPTSFGGKEGEGIKPRNGGTQHFDRLYCPECECMCVSERIAQGWITLTSKPDSHICTIVGTLKGTQLSYCAGIPCLGDDIGEEGPLSGQVKQPKECGADTLRPFNGPLKFCLGKASQRPGNPQRIYIHYDEYKYIDCCRCGSKDNAKVKKDIVVNRTGACASILLGPRKWLDSYGNVRYGYYGPNRYEGQLRKIIEAALPHLPCLE